MGNFLHFDTNNTDKKIQALKFDRLLSRIYENIISLLINWQEYNSAQWVRGRERIYTIHRIMIHVLVDLINFLVHMHCVNEHGNFTWFRMKCHLCDNHFEIKTDPANLDYVIVSGARRQENRWDPKENEQIVPETKEVSHRLYDDAMYKLEHKAEDKKVAKSRDKTLESAILLNEATWKDDYSSNCALRSAFRAKKKELQKKQGLNQLLLNKSGLKIDLVDEHEDDIKTAKLLTYNTKKDLSHTTRSPLKKLVSIVRSKNKTRNTSQSLLRIKKNASKQMLPKVEAATSSKSIDVPTSLVNYDGSSTDTEA
ncbi:hypothetical protein KPH14_009685 [Odynerus spinipes]|uniref:Uncharacterized protein n=1 Tax=Odynerus spinipes TaxID=1348599 RepID=A0AAD9RQI4_9HYME|nr:hypothetical protein KPH14_009685 [Odynerus spinipes]